MRNSGSLNTFSDKICTVIGTGATGAEVVSLLSLLLCNSTINVIDPANITGRILDLQHAACFNNNQLLYNNLSVLTECDYLIYAAGFQNAPGTTRNSVAVQNKLLTEQIFARIAVPPHCLVIVLSNPVDSVSAWVQTLLPNNLVTGTGTGLDTVRFKTILAGYFQLPEKEIHAMVVGEHGEHMIPLFSSATLSGTPLSKIMTTDEMNTAHNNLLHAAGEIRKTEPATRYGVAMNVITIIKMHAQTIETAFPVSLPVHLVWAKKLGVTAGSIFISLPTVFRQGKFELVDFTYSEKELNMLCKAAEAISKTTFLK